MLISKTGRQQVLEGIGVQRGSESACGGSRRVDMGCIFISELFWIRATRANISRRARTDSLKYGMRICSID